MFDEGAAIYLFDADSGTLTRLTTPGSDYSHPAFSGDGHYLSFIRISEFGNALILYDRTTGQKQSRWLEDNTTMEAWSPDGKMIALTSTKNDTPALILYTIASREWTEIPLIKQPYVVGLQWSPDSQSIALVLSNQPKVSTAIIDTPMPDQPSSVLLTYELTSGALNSVYEQAGGIRNLVWSPDSALIGFNTAPCIYCPFPIDAPDGTYQRELMYTMDRDGSNPTIIANPLWRITAVAWSPDSSIIGYAETKELAHYSLHFIDLSAGSERDLEDLFFVHGLNWSPDGQWIVTGGETTLRLLRSDTLDIVSSFGSPATLVPLGWSYDGKKLLLGTFCCGLRGLVYIDIDDPTVPHGVEDSIERDFIITRQDGVWAPNANLIAYVGYRGCRGCP